MTPMKGAEQRTPGKHREQFRSITLLESRSHAYLHVTGQPCYNHASPLAAHCRQEVRGQEFHGRVSFSLMTITTIANLFRNYHRIMLTFLPLYLFLFSLHLYFAMIRSLTGCLHRCVQFVLPSSICRSRLPRRDPHSRPNYDAENELIVIRSLAEYNHFLGNLADFFPEIPIAELPSEQTCSICRRRYDEMHDDFPLSTSPDRDDLAPWPTSLQNGHTRPEARDLISAVRLWRELPFTHDRRDLEYEEALNQDPPSPSPINSRNHSRTLNFENPQRPYSVSPDSAPSNLSGCPDSANSTSIGTLESATRLPCSHIFGQGCLRRWFAPRSDIGGGGTTCPLCRRVVFVLEMEFDRLESTWDEGQMEPLRRGVWGYESGDRRADRVIAARNRAAVGGRERRGGDLVVGDMGGGGLQRHRRAHRQEWSRLAGVVVGENGRVRRRNTLLTPRRRRSSF